LWLDDGDHSKCGINTMFNGTVVGVSANILAVVFREILYLVSLGGFWIYYLHHKKKHLKLQNSNEPPQPCSMIFYIETKWRGKNLNKLTIFCSFYQ
jgi:hypothetical protein